MRTITVVGAGFSGLTLAHELRELGFGVEVHERGEDAGGLIHSQRTPSGLVETAANSLLASRAVEELFDKLEVPMARRKRSRQKRFVYWEGPRRWPLSAGATWRLLYRATLFGLGLKGEEVMPRAGESVATWAQRFAGEEFLERLLSPALQGIYAGDPEQLSAVLILQSLLGDKPPKGDLRGSVAPTKGMGALIDALTKALTQAGVRIKYESAFQMPEHLTTPTVIATSAWHAAEIVRRGHPRLAAQLDVCQSLPIVSVTCFFDKTAADLKGFGCLFPRAQGFSSLGVVFNTCVFGGRSKLRSETWLLGGASDPECVAERDEGLIERVLRDRARLCGAGSADGTGTGTGTGTGVAASVAASASASARSTLPRPLNYRITRWSRGIPHYTVAWEKALKDLAVDPPLFLHGNYLGQIGLARIYARSRKLAAQIKEMYG